MNELLASLPAAVARIAVKRTVRTDTAIPECALGPVLTSDTELTSAQVKIARYYPAVFMLRLSKLLRCHVFFFCRPLQNHLASRNAAAQPRIRGICRLAFMGKHHRARRCGGSGERKCNQYNGNQYTHDVSPSIEQCQFPRNPSTAQASEASQ